MPSLGADMEVGTILEWRIGPGDVVHRGDIVAVVDTEKSDIEVEIFEDGVVEELLVEPGVEVPVGTPLARISPAGAVRARTRTANEARLGPLRPREPRARRVVRPGVAAGPPPRRRPGVGALGGHGHGSGGCRPGLGPRRPTRRGRGTTGQEARRCEGQRGAEGRARTGRDRKTSMRQAIGGADGPLEARDPALLPRHDDRPADRAPVARRRQRRAPGSGAHPPGRAAPEGDRPRRRAGARGERVLRRGLPSLGRRAPRGGGVAPRRRSGHAGHPRRRPARPRRAHGRAARRGPAGAERSAAQLGDVGSDDHGDQPRRPGGRGGVRGHLPASGGAGRLRPGGRAARRRGRDADGASRRARRASRPTTVCRTATRAPPCCHR